MMQAAEYSTSRPTVVPLDADRMHAMCRRLPPYPPLAKQLIEIFSQDDCDLYSAVALIRSDAVFSGELLRISNSAEFASYEPFEDVAQAVMYLGFERVQSAIRRITYARLMKDSFRHPYLAEIHRNNLACALVCERLLKACGPKDTLDDFCPYSLGLYLKIGALVLLRAFPNEYPAFLCSNLPSGAVILEREKAKFGFSHVDISRHLVAHWEFLEAFQLLVAGHIENRSPGADLSVADGAWLASQLAGAFGYSFYKGLHKPAFEELVRYIPENGRSELPATPQDWRDLIDGHLRELSL